MMDNERDELGFYESPPIKRRRENGRAGGWIGILRAFLWVWFALLIICGVFSGISVMFARDGGVVIGLCVIVVSVLAALLSIAGGMVALDAAQDVKRGADNTELLLRELENRK